MTTAYATAPEGILPMRRGWPRARHVLKHLYRRSERWDLVVKGLPKDLRQRALQAGCSLIDRVQNGSERWERLSRGGARLVEADHEAFYRPAYMHSIETSRGLGRVCHLGAGSDRLALVGDNGVFVIATDGTDGRAPRTVSAYRVSPYDFENATPEQFVEAAVRKWNDKKALAQDTWQHEDVEDT
ncbi:hypothetical protein ATI61_106312 [Archangium gephyra]|uniref:Uncharacterized protein n=1 Tax=Archangium gephyra TaxID=48 RepID=A0AAC8TAN9_9BACT|nr:hypothetical protein [Archangium gephyra]AKI98931.1 Hypothetical protein AA314_00558 [Archangium gephyra]REG30842.1 hypothetical protein ATI61_106312 [Archangium gephyra]